MTSARADVLPLNSAMISCSRSHRRAAVIRVQSTTTQHERTLATCLFGKVPPLSHELHRHCIVEGNLQTDELELLSHIARTCRGSCLALKADVKYNKLNEREQPLVQTSRNDWRICWRTNSKTDMELPSIPIQSRR